MHRMESWTCGYDGRAPLLSDEVPLPIDALICAKEVMTSWDLKNTCNYENPLLVPSPETAENQGLMEIVFDGTLRTGSTDKTIGYTRGSKVNDAKTVSSSPHLFGQKKHLREEELGSKDSSSFVGTDGQNSSYMDLNLGRSIEFKDVNDNKCPKDARSSLLVPSTVPPKKIRSAGLNGQIPFCQVHGCNMNLRYSKDYHKRHKVCEIHSKTAKVIVNGIEQRFCQQCSRFHLLAEFDNGKRSCRRRLACHNERRRKPQLDIHSGRTGKLLQSYHGGRLLDASLPIRSSFHCPEIYPGGILHKLEHENVEWCQRAKTVDNDRQTRMPTINGQLVSKPFLSHYRTEKQISSVHGVSSPLGNIFYGQEGQASQGYAGSESSIPAFPRVGESLCALSLLSSEPENVSSYSSAIPMVQPLMFTGGQAQNNVTQFSEKPLPMISQASTNVTSNRFSFGINSRKEESMDLLVSDHRNLVKFGVQTGAINQGSQFMNARETLSPQPGDTVNLLQLSSLLQRAEEQRISTLAKQEYEALSCHPITQVQ